MTASKTHYKTSIAKYRAQVKTKDKLLSSIHKISQLLNHPITRDKILYALVKETKRIFDFQRVVIFLLDGNLLWVKYQIGFSPKEVERARKHPLDMRIHQCRETLVAKTGKTIYIRNSKNSSMVTEFDFKMDRIWSRSSTISMPLKIKNEIIGVLQGDRMSRELVLSKSDIKMFSTFASQASTIIENARLHEQTQKKVSQLMVLQEVSKKTSSTMNFHKLLDIISVNALKITEASVCSLFLVDRDNKFLRIVSQKGCPQGIDVDKFRMRVGEGIVGWVAEKGVPLLVNNVNEEPRYMEVITGIGSKLAVPLVSEKEVLGVLSVDSYNKSAFSLDDLELLMVFASHTAILIDNVRLYEQILEERNRAENLLESSPNGIVAIDGNKRLRSINKKAEFLLNVRRRSVLGKRICDVFKGDILYTFNEAVEKRSQMNNREMEVSKVDGRRIYGLTSVLMDTEENSSGVLISIHDLTEQKKTEELIRRMDRLSSLGQLSAGMAHEIRNPLASINFNVQLLAKKLEKAEVAQNILSDTFEGINRINLLVKRILDFTKTGTPAFKSAKLNDVLEEAIALISPQLNKKKITVKRQFGKVPESVFDPHQIQQVLVNLLLNAMESIQDGKGLIEIITSVEKGPARDRLVLTVRDNGSGIAGDNLYKIFDPFFTTKPEGTGLGLSIVHKILEQHDATIEIKSKEGKGTSFILGFPIRMSSP